MQTELSFLLLTPGMLDKSCTGGILSRLLSRTQLELAGAQILEPDRDTVKACAELVLKHSDEASNTEARLLHDYLLTRMAPDNGGTCRLVLFLFRGDHAVEVLKQQAGSLNRKNRNMASMPGTSIRDTYAELVMDKDGCIQYIEPAVIVPHSRVHAMETMTLLARFLEHRDNLIQHSEHANSEAGERTLVILKPENWKAPSGRPGFMMDMLSVTGLRMAGMKMLQMTLAEALEFYGQLEAALQNKLSGPATEQAIQLLEKKFDLKLDTEAQDKMLDAFGTGFARYQFGSLIEYMTGRRPEDVPVEQYTEPGTVKSMVLVYEGEQAVRHIRNVLGPTDPANAPGGTIRHDFGTDVLVNAMHASDSADSYTRESDIVRINRNDCWSIMKQYPGE